MIENSENKKLPMSTLRRRAARLAAVQALYQRELNQDGPASVLLENFMGDLKISIGKNRGEGKFVIEPEWKFVKTIFTGVQENKEELDSVIKPALTEGLNYERLGPLLGSILHAGAYELLYHTKTPRKIAVSEYVAAADAFLDESEVGFVNAVLDRVQKPEI